MCCELAMKALIIAAGQGIRLAHSNHSKSKPLLHLLGVPLITRVILTAKRAGINEFIIVVGYLGEQIRKELGDGRKYNIKITYVENREWENGNGISVLKAKELLKDLLLYLTRHS